MYKKQKERKQKTKNKKQKQKTKKFQTKTSVWCKKKLVVNIRLEQ